MAWITGREKGVARREGVNVSGGGARTGGWGSGSGAGGTTGGGGRGAMTTGITLATVWSVGAVPATVPFFTGSSSWGRNAGCLRV